MSIYFHHQMHRKKVSDNEDIHNNCRIHGFERISLKAGFWNSSEHVIQALEALCGLQQLPHANM